MNEPAEAGTLIPPTSNPALAQALADRLAALHAAGGSFGMLEALATLLGLIQNSLAPRVATATLAIVAADHGFAAALRGAAPRSGDTLAALRDGRVPLAALARLHDATLAPILASGSERATAESEPPVLSLVATTADARRGAAMTAAQAHAALRQGMRESERMRGGVLACAGLGLGSTAAAALVLGTLTQRDPLDFLDDAGEQRASIEAVREHHAALWRPGAARDPVDVLAAVGGLEIATLTGLVLGAAARRQLVLVDGLAALAAMQVAQRIAPYVPDYCIPVRSRAGRGLGAALALGRPALPSALDLDAMDGTAGVLSLPLLRSAAALLARPDGRV
jgi:nicotinate-nucleotide--dimethylbenzimidazole phosphoribosyltransferase